MIANRTPPPSPAESLIQDAKALSQQLYEFAKTLAHMSETLFVFAASPEDLWVHEYGEAVTAKQAAKIIGRTTRTLSNMINAGAIARTPDGNILIRDLARWANSNQLKQERTKTTPTHRAVK